MLGLNVTYFLKPGKREAFLEALGAAGIQAAVCQEEGCIQYDYFLPLDHADQLLLVEKWSSREAQKVHLTQPHMAKFRAMKDQFVDDTKLEVYEPKD